MLATPDLPEAHSSTDMVYTAHSKHGPTNYFWSSQSLETVSVGQSSGCSSTVKHSIDGWMEASITDWCQTSVCL